MSTGPAAVLVHTLWKLGWTIDKPHVWLTPAGESINLDMVCPKDLKKLISIDAARWAWSRAIPKHVVYQHLDGPPFLDPVVKALNQGGSMARKKGLEGSTGRGYQI